jgi:uncharacterized protein (UPF0332 family)
MKYNENAVELSKHRLATAKDTFSIAQVCFENEGYRDAVNRSYYATFYALRAVLALEGVDFKRHKDVVAYFNQHYVATEKFNRNLGRRIGRLKTMREDCDYDDFFVVCPTRGVENLGKSAEEMSAGFFGFTGNGNAIS